MKKPVAAMQAGSGYPQTYRTTKKVIAVVITMTRLTDIP